MHLHISLFLRLSFELITKQKDTILHLHMFYNHEVLTSRKHGVATVWLVATLGSKSALKRVNRKAILEVDIPRACETILKPIAPMALRLQGSLLYGASRVYSQQCDYVLSDAQNARNSLRARPTVNQPAELDPEAGRTKPEHLLLEDDPTFLPQLVLGFLDDSPLIMDAAHLSPTDNFELLTSPHSSLFKPVVIPSSDSAGQAGFEDYGLHSNDMQVHSGVSNRLAESVNLEEGFLPDADFSFDAEGNLLELVTPAKQTSRLGDAQHSAFNVADDVDRFEAHISKGLDQATPAPLQAEPADHLPHDFSGGDLPMSQDPSLYRPSPVDATFRQKRMAPRIIKLDTAAELRNADISQWNQCYLENMSLAISKKYRYRNIGLAKKNADYWVFGHGIGGVGAGLGSSHFPSPLYDFAGQALSKVLATIGRTSYKGLKREYENQSDPAEEARRVRARLEEPGSAAHDILPDAFEGGPNVNDVEVARDAPLALDDLSSAMPWNISASARGSSISRGAFGPLSAFAGSAGVSPSAGFAGARLHHRTSASPLLGRGNHGQLEGLRLVEDEDFSLINLPASSQFSEGDVELHGPAHAGGTQTSAHSQWLRSTLHLESQNFLDFVKNVSMEKMGAASAEQPPPAVLEISFRELLPPEENSRIVGAHGLFHVLALATQGLLSATQESHGKEIYITLH